MGGVAPHLQNTPNCGDQLLVEGAQEKRASAAGTGDSPRLSGLSMEKHIRMTSVSG